MIIVVSDAKGFTQRAEQTPVSGLRNLYCRLFEGHIRIQSPPGIEWRVIKTTGDGMLITAHGSENEEFFQNWCVATYNLFSSLNSKRPMRVVAHWCADGDKRLIRGLQLSRQRAPATITNIQTFNGHLAEDIFGPSVNLVFRLIQVVPSRSFVLTDCLTSRIAGQGSKRQWEIKHYFDISGFRLGPPVPLTHIRGVTKVGFSSERGRSPLWLWEVSKIRMRGATSGRGIRFTS